MTIAKRFTLILPIGVRAGGARGAAAPRLQKFLKFFGQNADDSGKVLGRKYSKRLSKPDLKATFSDVCPVKTELKSNDLRIQVFVLEKPYIVYMCIVEDLQPRAKPVETHSRQKYLFFALTLTKMFTVAN